MDPKSLQCTLLSPTLTKNQTEVETQSSPDSHETSFKMLTISSPVNKKADSSTTGHCEIVCSHTNSSTTGEIVCTQADSLTTGHCEIMCSLAEGESSFLLDEIEHHLPQYPAGAAITATRREKGRRSRVVGGAAGDQSSSAQSSGYNSAVSFELTHEARLLPYEQTAEGNYLEPCDVLAAFNCPRLSVTILDARFKYEFDAGHIKIGSVEALHTPSEVGLRDAYFSEEALEKAHLHIILFHCEFSQKRGPRLFSQFRRLDRQLSEWPALYYPEVYIIKGGYSAFFAYCKETDKLDYCSGGDGGYVLMHDKKFKTECVKGMQKMRGTDTSSQPRRLKATRSRMNLDL